MTNTALTINSTSTIVSTDLVLEADLIPQWAIRNAKRDGNFHRARVMQEANQALKACPWSGKDVSGIFADYLDGKIKLATMVNRIRHESVIDYNGYTSSLRPECYNMFRGQMNLAVTEIIEDARCRQLAVANNRILELEKNNQAKDKANLKLRAAISQMLEAYILEDLDAVVEILDMASNL